jgi:hypothetical protein
MTNNLQTGSNQPDVRTIEVGIETKWELGQPWICTSVPIVFRNRDILNEPGIS